MQIGVAKECVEGERHVALVPAVVRKLWGGDRGIEVVVERGAGAGALIPDAQYEEAGARSVDDPVALFGSDVRVKVAAPTADEIARLRSDGVLIGFLAPVVRGQGDSGIAGSGGDESCDGGDSADQSGAVDGCVVVAGEHLRLPLRADRRPLGGI